MKHYFDFAFFKITAPLLLAFSFSSCENMGNKVVSTTTYVDPSSSEIDPCFDSSVSLTDGIQNGAELKTVFDCLNKNGDFDTFYPLIDAMNNTSIYELGKEPHPTVLDMWVTTLNNTMELSSESSSSIQVSDLAVMLDGTIELLNKDWVPSVIEIVGDSLEEGITDPLLSLLGSMSHEVIHDSTFYSTSDNDKAIFRELLKVLCPNFEDKENLQCTGHAQQVYKGMVDMFKTYGTEDFPMGTSEEIVGLLADLLAPKGFNESDNLALNIGLGRGLAKLGAENSSVARFGDKGDFLTHTLGTYLPELYGDDLDTNEHELGYESYDMNQSALFALLTLMANPDFQNQMLEQLSGLEPLLNKYYIFNPISLGNAVALQTPVTCESIDGSFQTENPAYYGLDQILRLVKGADVDYTDRTIVKNPLCQFAMETLISIYQPLYGVELSGSTNIVTVMLELFSQMPVEDVVLMTNSSSINGTLLEVVNELCSVNVIPDDMEALQASVNMVDVLAPTLKLLAVVSHADFPGKKGLGGMETLKDLLVDLYDTHMLCDSRPWLSSIATKDGPLIDAIVSTVNFFPNPIDSESPSTHYHDTITLPLLKLLNDFQEQPANVIIPPISKSLASQGDNLGKILQALGKMANLARESAENGGDPALYHLLDVVYDLNMEDKNYQSITLMAKALNEEIKQDLVVTSLLQTLALPEVRDSFNVAYSRKGSDFAQTPTEYLSETVNSGELLNLLYTVRDLLEILQYEIKG